MRHYCTIFDSNYAPAGLTMIKSLIRHSVELPTIHVLAMDEECMRTMRAMNLRGVEIWEMEPFEKATGMELVKPTRTEQEYAWTCGSVFTDYIASKFLADVTYLDADMMFASDPERIFDEIGEKSIGITPHRFAEKDRRRLEPNGRFCVQWVTLKGVTGRSCLRRWSRQCKDWCKYENAGPGFFGDQGYLDEWPAMYAGEVCEITNPGAGLAPWNIANFNVHKIGNSVMVDNHPLIFYHFHELLRRPDGSIRLTNWPLRDQDKELIYRPYIQSLQEQAHSIVAIDHGQQMEQTAAY